MSLLSDKSIEKFLNKEIVIDPYNPGALTPVGYDFTIGDFVYSLEDDVLSPVDGFYEIPSKSTVRILTKESLWVSGKIGGSFHSKVSLVSQGLSHISTTLDPGWFGPLLITMRNNTNTPFKLKANEKFVTLLFYKVLNKTKSKHNKPPFRRDILIKQLSSKTKKYIDKVEEILDDESLINKFKEKVEKANAPLIQKLLSLKYPRLYKKVRSIIIHVCFWILILFLSTLGFYWSELSHKIFNDIVYDSKIISAQLTGFIALIILYYNIILKNK